MAFGPRDQPIELSETLLSNCTCSKPLRQLSLVQAYGVHVGTGGIDCALRQIRRTTRRVCNQLLAHASDAPILGSWWLLQGKRARRRIPNHSPTHRPALSSAKVAAVPEIDLPRAIAGVDRRYRRVFH